MSFQMHTPPRRRAGWPAFALDVVIPCAIVLAVWAKLGVFNRNLTNDIVNDWSPWSASNVFWATVSALGPLLILVSPCLLPRRGRRVAALLALDVVLSVMVLADVVHFRFFNDVISMSALGEAPQLALIGSNIAALLKPRDVLFVADIVVLSLAAIPLARAARALPLPPKRRRRAAVTALVLGALISIVPIRIVYAEWNTTFGLNWFRFMGVRRIGLLNYHLFGAGREIVRELRLHKADPADRERVERYLSARRAAESPSPSFGAARGRNVIIVMVESLDAFLVDLSIDGRPVMPNLARFAARSMSFDRIFTQTWSASTADGEITSLQSVHPLMAGAVQTRFTHNDFRGLPQVLADNGYSTMSAHAYAGDLWKRREVYPKFGFQRMYFREAYAPGARMGLGLADIDFVRQTVPMLARQPRPFLAFLVTLSTHFAYSGAPAEDVVHPALLEDRVLGRFLDAAHYTDRALGELFAELSRNGMLDSSIVVLYGDHPAINLGPRNDLYNLLQRYGGLPAPTQQSEVAYWAARNRIPFIVHLPGDSLAGHYQTSGGQLDFAPTVLALLGMRPGQMPALGRDLTADDVGFAVMRDGAYVRGDTLCRRPASAPTSYACALLSTGAPLGAPPDGRWGREAAEELRISDLMIEGNMLVRVGSGRR